jgi:3-oxoacyl-[acyl-carrier protein] reductase
MAIRFAHEGCHVVVNYYRQEVMAEKVVTSIRESGGDAFAVQANVCDLRAVRHMVDMTIQKFGGVDILVNNAGISTRGGPLIDLQEEDFDVLFNINVKGIVFGTQAVAPHMMAQGRGKIINISSVAGLGTSLLPGNHLYASTKASINTLTKRLALELGLHGICVNAIAPGLIRTEMSLGQRTFTERRDRIRYFQERSMLRRIGKPEDIANVALFLASDESNFITGQVITVDGGRLDFLTH